MADKVAMAIVAHPDDIEFMAAGTLLLLRDCGYTIHYMTIADGCCGSMTMSADETRERRRQESQAAAALLGASWHPPLCGDMEIVYELGLMRRLAAVVRGVNPSIILTHSPQDYMEDHMATSRLVVSAAFVKNIPNLVTEPAAMAAAGDVTIYHGMPHGLCDQLRQEIVPDAYIDTSSVHAQKREALAAHSSQKQWLDDSQGFDSYLVALDEMSAELGRRAGGLGQAEGWRRHLHLGFSAAEKDPMAEALGDYFQTTQA